MLLHNRMVQTHYTVVCTRPSGQFCCVQISKRVFIQSTDFIGNPPHTLIQSPHSKMMAAHASFDVREEVLNKQDTILYVFYIQMRYIIAEFYFTFSLFCEIFQQNVWNLLVIIELCLMYNITVGYKYNSELVVESFFYQIAFFIEVLCAIVILAKQMSINYLECDSLSVIISITSR